MPCRSGGSGRAARGHEPGSARGSWYVYKAQTGREALAEQHLRNQEFRVFAPKLKVTRRTAGRLVDTIKPLFSGYGFVSFDGSAGHWRSINGTRGVSYLICGGGRPVAVPDDFMAGLIRLAGEGDVIAMNGAQMCERLKPGDSVELVQGPFAGQVGKLVRMNASGRIRVLLSALNGGIAVETRAASVIVLN
jgi:transcriptional antiterminator RfaH